MLVLRKHLEPHADVFERTVSPLKVPPLGNGDHLTLEEFERRWAFHPEIKKAELIDGAVFRSVSIQDISNHPSENRHSQNCQQHKSAGNESVRPERNGSPSAV